MADDAPYRSLYRRFRPQRFAEIRGQDHVVRALTNAVRDDRVAHAYLFSGPRGTGKTSTARILAKALNCPDRTGGEPCGVCASCVAVERGSSLDVHELDAASHNGVEAMRDLVSRAALGTPGRRKVYIVDEVHMLSTAASNALLKTLEEPPDHVVFVLATTDPQKVLQTVRSRTQHLDFRLLGSDVLAGLLADVNAAAGLGLAAGDLDQVVRRGRGSARDALSVLDQVAAAGEVDDEVPMTDEVVEALCERDAARALVAVAQACAAGRDPRRLAADLTEHVHAAFLLTQAPSLAALSGEARDRVADQARRLGPAALVRALEALGQAQVDMREALDPRVTFDAVLVRLARPDADTSVAALVERVERLERDLAAGAAPVAAPAPAATRTPEARPRPSPPPPPPPTATRTPPPPGPPSRRPPPPPPNAAAPPPAAAPPVPSPEHQRPLPTRDQLTKAWGDTVLSSLGLRAKARFGGGRFVAVEDGRAVFALPNAHFLPRCDEVRPDVEAALAAHFGTPVPLRLVVEPPDSGPPATDESAPSPGPGGDPFPDDPIYDIDLDDLRDAGPSASTPPEVSSAEERLKRAFPGAEEVST